MGNTKLTEEMQQELRQLKAEGKMPSEMLQLMKERHRLNLKKDTLKSFFRREREKPQEQAPPEISEAEIQKMEQPAEAAMPAPADTGPAAVFDMTPAQPAPPAAIPQIKKDTLSSSERSEIARQLVEYLHTFENGIYEEVTGKPINPKTVALMNDMGTKLGEKLLPQDHALLVLGLTYCGVQATLIFEMKKASEARKASPPAPKAPPAAAPAQAPRQGPVIRPAEHVAQVAN